VLIEPLVDGVDVFDGSVSVCHHCDASIGVEKLLSNKNIERRVLSSLQDAGTSEPWVQHAVKVAPDGQNSMVIVWPNGQSEVKQIPSNLDSMQEIVSEW